MKRVQFEYTDIEVDRMLQWKTIQLWFISIAASVPIIFLALSTKNNNWILATLPIAFIGRTIYTEKYAIKESIVKQGTALIGEEELIFDFNGNRKVILLADIVKITMPKGFRIIFKIHLKDQEELIIKPPSKRRTKSRGQDDPNTDDSWNRATNILEKEIQKRLPTKPKKTWGETY